VAVACVGDGGSSKTDTYAAINSANLFLKGLSDNISKVDATLAKQYAAEAKFVRALSYFSLVTLYARPYVEDNGASKALPLRLQAETSTANNNMTRSTVAEVYTQILKDLDEAETGCDRIVVLNRGTIAAQGTPRELIRHQPDSRAVLYAHMREPLPHFFLKGLRKRLGKSVEVEVTGRRMRLAADTQEMLGKALAMVLADGIVLETFRTPPGRLETLMRHPTPQPEEATAE